MGEVTRTQTQELTMRGLQASDVITVLSLLANSVGTAEEVRKLLGDISKQRNDWTAVGISAVWGIVQGLLVRDQEATIAWLASLVSLRKEEFDKLPATAVIDVCEQLVNHEDFADFFARLEALFTRSGGGTSEQAQPTPEPTPAASSTVYKLDTAGVTT